MTSPPFITPINPVSPNAALGLPELPSELKSLAPYVQRASELKSKDPVISYWCLYFATKQGIGIRVRDKDSRPFLFKLMETLESLKKENRNNEAVASDAAGYVYVENFGLKVFNAADNEDRKGNSTRSTAKKFLAAANFLEILKIFTKETDKEAAKVNEEKIRYAKWKAADIAKAFREGRKPTPGPAGSSFNIDPAPSPSELNIAFTDSDGTGSQAAGGSSTGPANGRREPSATRGLSPTPMHIADGSFGSIPNSVEPSPLPTHLPLPQSPQPPNIEIDPSTPTASPVGGKLKSILTAPSNLKHLAVIPGTPDVGTPGAWSTAATPGLDRNEDPFKRTNISDAFPPSPTPGANKKKPNLKRNLPFGDEAGKHGGDGDTDPEEDRAKDPNRSDTLVMNDERPRQGSSGNWSMVATMGDSFSRNNSLAFGSASNSANPSPNAVDPNKKFITQVPLTEEPQSGEQEDILHPLPPMKDKPFTYKKVHFSGSVVGGMSSVASSSPPPSPPGSPYGSTYSIEGTIPLPPSADNSPEGSVDGGNKATNSALIPYPSSSKHQSSSAPPNSGLDHTYAWQPLPQHPPSSNSRSSGNNVLSPKSPPAPPMQFASPAISGKSLGSTAVSSHSRSSSQSHSHSHSSQTQTPHTSFTASPQRTPKPLPNDLTLSPSKATMTLSPPTSTTTTIATIPMPSAPPPLPLMQQSNISASAPPLPPPPPQLPTATQSAFVTPVTRPPPPTEPTSKSEIIRSSGGTAPVTNPTRRPRGASQSGGRPNPTATGPPPPPPPPKVPSPPLVPVAAPLPTSLPPEKVSLAQKRARFAISALDFEDLETARKELQHALDILAGK